MRRANGLVFLIVTLLTLTSCLPDSFTKFKEDTPTEEPISSGGGGGSTGPTIPAVCVPGNPGSGFCTPPTGLTYSSATFAVAIPSATASNPATLLGATTGLIDSATNQEIANSGSTLDFTTFALAPGSPALPAGLELDSSTGEIRRSSASQVFHNQVSHTIRATFAGSTTVFFDFVVTISQANPITNLNYPQIGGMVLVLQLQTGEAANFLNSVDVSTASGARGRITYVDTTNDEVHIVLDHLASGTAASVNFQNSDQIDNSSQFFSSAGTITDITYAFDAGDGTTPGFGQVHSGFLPVISPTVTSAEASSITYSISPALPSHMQILTTDAAATTFTAANTFVGTGHGPFSAGNIVVTGPSQNPQAAETTSLPPTTYVLSARDILGNAASTTIRLSRVEQRGQNANPKTITGVTLRQSVGTRLVLTVDDATSFVGQTQVATSNGSVASIRLVDTSANQVFVEVTSIANSTPPGVVTPLQFAIGDSLDNRAPFFNQEATIQDLEYAFSTTDNIHVVDPVTAIVNTANPHPLEFFPQIVDNTSPTARNIDLTGNAKADVIYTTAPVLPVAPDAVDSFSLRTYLSDGAGSGGINNDPTRQAIASEPNPLNSRTDLSTVSYQVTATNALGRSFTDTIKFRIETAPENLSYTSQVILEVNDVSAFSRGNFISNRINPPLTTGALGQVARVFDAPDNRLLVNIQSGTFSPGDSLDNISQFAVERARITNANSRIRLSVANSATFSQGGSVSNASGALGTVVAVIGAPDHILVVDILNGSFTNGENIDNASSFVATETTVAAVPTTISSGGVKRVSAILTVPTSSFNKHIYEVETPVLTSSTGAKAIPQFYHDNDTVPTTDDRLYVKVVSGQFGVGDLVNDDTTPGAPAQTISEVQANNIQLDLTMTNVANAEAAFMPGHDFVSANAVGIVTSVSTNTVSVQVNEGLFGDGDNVDRINPFGSSHDHALGQQGPAVTAQVNASSVKQENHFELYRNEAVTIEASTQNGENLNYSITPDLPTGLVIDANTGNITGAPEDASPRTTYTVTASNSIGQTSHTFSLRVSNHFQIVDQTASTSYIMHKAGQNNMRTDCRVTQDQITAGTTGTGDTRTHVSYRDINCLLDVAELDLNQRGLQLKANVSHGICSFFEFKPYAVHDWRPIQSSTSSRTFVTQTGPSVCVDANFKGAAPNVALGEAAGENPFGVPRCFGDYTNFDGPNCDEGSYTLETVNYNDQTDCTNITVTTTTVDCTGSAVACLNGPISEVITTANLNLGITSVTLASEFGINAGEDVWTISNRAYRDSSGRSYNNLYANYTGLNSCNTENKVAADDFSYMVRGWIDYANDRNEAGNNTATADTQIGNSDARDFDPFRGDFTNPYYTFNCRDEATDLTARVQLQVREWDRTFTAFDGVSTGDNSIHFQGYVSSVPAFDDTPTGNADNLQDTGLTEDGFGVAYNNISDWDDLLRTQSAGTSMTGCYDQNLVTGGGILESNDTAPTEARTTGTGTISLTAGSTVATGAGTAFTTEIVSTGTFIGDLGFRDGVTIAVDVGAGNIEYHIVRFVRGATDLELVHPAITTVAGATFYIVKSYPFPRVKR